MSRRNTRTLKILENVYFHDDSKDNNIENYIVEKDGFLLPQKENANPELICVTDTPQNILICKDGSLRVKSYGIRNIETTNPQDPLEISFLDQDLVTHNIDLPTSYSCLSNISNPTILPDEVSLTTIETDDSTTHVTNTQRCGSAEKTINFEEIKKPPSKRFKKSHPNEWTINKNKKSREEGKEYLGKKKIDDKCKYCEPKPSRQLKERCKCKLSLKGNTKLQREKISDADRIKICQKFWSFTWKEKKIFIKSSSICKSTNRKRSDRPTSRRQRSVELYLLSDDNEDKYRVCKKMFLNTLSIGEWVIKKWIIVDQEHDDPKENPKNNAKPDEMLKLKQFFEKLPKVESHYCRRDSSKLYLEPMWTSKNQLFRTYKNDYCELENVKPLSIASFCNVFDELNLSLYRPKKDLCDICEGFKTGNILYKVYKLHIEKKEEARHEKYIDKETDHLVLTMDLQSVLLSPRSNVSSLYYKTKLVVHNFTLYDIKKKKGYCYIWNETEGKLTANEFATIIIEALNKLILETPLVSQEIILYSDGCTYQNRNAVLSNALLNFCMENKVTLTQKYLEKGHTQMECDCMHSVIEKALKHKKINVPADYAYVAKTACKKSPYEVTYLYHYFFKNMEHTLKFYKSIRPGKKVGDPAVTDLRALRYITDGTILYKLRHSDTDWQKLPTRVKNIDFIPFARIPQLYKARLQIKKEKFQHLQELKQTMEKDYHNFYDNLPHF